MDIQGLKLYTTFFEYHFFPKKDIKLFCPAAFAFPFFLSPAPALKVLLVLFIGLGAGSLSSSSENDSYTYSFFVTTIKNATWDNTKISLFITLSSLPKYFPLAAFSFGRCSGRCCSIDSRWRIRGH
jgi:hypothetical protein